MSDDQPATPEASEVTGAPAPATVVAQRARAMDAFKAHMSGKAAPERAEDAEEPPEAAGEPGAAEEPATPADDAKDSLRLAKALRDLAGLQAENVKLKREHGSYGKELEQARGLLAKGKSLETVLEFLEDATGLDYPALTRAIVEGKAKPNNRARVPDEYAEKLRKLEEREAERERELATHREKEALREEAAAAKTWLTSEEASAEYPLLAATSWGADRLVAVARERGGAEAAEVALDLEKALRQNVESILQDPRALKALIDSSGKVKDAISKAMGSAGRPAQGDSSEPGKRATNGGRALSSLSSGSVPIDRSKMTQVDKSKHAASEFARYMAAKRKS